MQTAILSWLEVKHIPTFDNPSGGPQTKPKFRMKGLGEYCGGKHIPDCMEEFQKFGVKDHHDLQTVACWNCPG